MSTPTIAPAGAADLETVLDLIQSYFTYDQIPFEAVAVRAGLRVLFDDASLGWVLVVRGDDGRIWGYSIVSLGIDLEFGGRTATITDLYFRPEKRRLGLGTQMLSHIEAACEAAGIRAIELQVERDNHEAQALYAKFGFTAHERIPMSKRIAGAT